MLIGIPACQGADTTCHKSNGENIRHALTGMYAALLSYPVLPENHRGIAIYCDWEMNDVKWQAVADFFERNPAR